MPGFGGAPLVEEALWTVTLLVAPAALAYVGFRRSVEETRRLRRRYLLANSPPP